MSSSQALLPPLALVGLDAARAKDEDDDAEYEELIPPENFAMIEKGLYRSACSLCLSLSLALLGGDVEDPELTERSTLSVVHALTGGFPKKKNFAFLKKCLGLRSILTLVLEDYPLANSEFNRMHNIKLLQFGVPGNKVAGEQEEATVTGILQQWLTTSAASAARNRSWTSQRTASSRRSKPCSTSATTRCSSTATRARCGLVLCGDTEQQHWTHVCHGGRQHRTGCLVGSLRKVQKWAFSSIFDEYIRFSAPKPRMMDQQVRLSVFRATRAGDSELTNSSSCLMRTVHRVI